MRHAGNDEEFVHADFINIALVFVLADVRPLVESSFDVKIGAFFEFRRKNCQISVEDEAEPIGVLGRLVLACEAIGLSKAGIGNGHGGRQIKQRGFRCKITGELKAVLLHSLSLRIEIQTFY